MDKQFFTGDVVMLNSGGIPMTVISSDGHHIKTVWFDYSCALHQGEFLSWSLEITDKKLELT
jgi:uncharacterized protein YodC (DUF2158 family)